jgi:hypothetical protein
MPNEEPMIRIAALWKNTSREGEAYLSGYLGDARLYIFKNKFKEEGTRQPDYLCFVKAKERRDDPAPRKQETKDTGITDADLPF